MVAGHLREQNGYYQMILSWKGKDGKRKGKSISTGLPVKGNKKRAEAMLLKTRKESVSDRQCDVWADHHSSVFVKAPKAVERQELYECKFDF